MRPLLPIVLCAVAFAAQNQPVIRVNTRLVEVDVVVRNSRGPVAGLTQQDFTLLDQGKPQKISIFSAKSSSNTQPIPAPPPGLFVNRLPISPLAESAAAPTGATVVLVDRLNTAFEFQPYMIRQLLQLLGGMKPGSPIALYTLGRDLNVVYDFTEDPDRLIQAAATLSKPHSALDPTSNQIKTALEEVLNLEQVDRPFVTADALKLIARHLSGVHGRKGLVWLSGSFPLVNPRIIGQVVDAQSRR
jgi:VWFA-related protein